MYTFPEVDYYYYDDTIIFIFLIAGVCGGLPALVWALLIIYNHHKNGGQISAFVLLLLLNDLLELLLSLFTVSYLYSDNTVTFTLDVNQISWPEYVHRYINIVYGVVNALWVTLRIGGLYLHQMVALQSILSLKNPTCTAHIFSPPCSIIMCVILWLLLFVYQLFYFRLILNTVLCLLPFCILIVTCIRSCKVSPNHGHEAGTGMKAGSAVLIVSTLTLFSVCAPSITVFVNVFQGKPYTNIHDIIKAYMVYDTMYAFLVSVRVVSDPLLCVLVCKEKLRDQTRTHTELNTDHQSV